MKALLLLASLYWLGETPAEAQQEEADDQGFKVYSRREVIYISNLDGSGGAAAYRRISPGTFTGSDPDGLRQTG